MDALEKKLDELTAEFHRLFGEIEPGIWSAPGRTEIGGNHTDHQHGKVLAGAVDAAMYAAAAPNGSDTVRIKSGDRPMMELCLDTLAPAESEKGTSVALVRGMCAQCAERGFPVRGFDACVCSDVPKGSGLSSSAAFEILVGAVLNSLFCGDSLSATDLAIMGQKTENVYFGKPCGLMDQMACAWGGIIAIDFENPDAPSVTPVQFRFASAHHSLCLIDLHADHANLTDEYAAIPAELKAVSAFFGKQVLREVPEAEFYAHLPELRRTAGDRAVLRAIHIYNDNRRVDAMTEALTRNDFARFLRLVRDSSLSSWLCLQNVVVSGSTADQAAAVAQALCGRLLGERGAFRIHGGGFGGTVQAFVPDELLDSFREGIEAVFGPGSCRVMQIRQVGFCKVR